MRIVDLQVIKAALHSSVLGVFVATITIRRNRKKSIMMTLLLLLFFFIVFSAFSESGVIN